ncbi:hypothetical protein CBR_g36888 [Chara braunii]|uniref:Glycosyl hydrolase family 32 N-terminal domain-containing protein n=1 Tax=Chara braunii TaxID=69332 RepID=A0A388LM10_CHABU|nr:hypothetical protein CBR_g36888 [Chara braunii]|eukprot:GBG83273.1 hypothetical protein CBR_g36888 [Chara braunii]
MVRRRPSSGAERTKLWYVGGMWFVVLCIVLRHGQRWMQNGSSSSNVVKRREDWLTSAGVLTATITASGTRLVSAQASEGGESDGYPTGTGSSVQGSVKKVGGGGDDEGGGGGGGGGGIEGRVVGRPRLVGHWNGGRRKDDEEFAAGEVIDPRRGGEPWFVPGRIWLDMDGKPIQAHGGSILFVPTSKTFYWYGENKDGPTYKPRTRNALLRVDLVGVSCYKSQDLWSWTDLGLVLKADKQNASSDLHVSQVLERPKVIFNERTEQFVMWMHMDNGTYDKASVGVATSSSPEGPFEYLGSFRPNGQESRDMTVFQDDDGSAYLVYASQKNTAIHVTPLTDDYLSVQNRFSQHFKQMEREAPVVFKYDGSYLMITSACTGWRPNLALLHQSKSMMGHWRTLGNPMSGGAEEMWDLTFWSQGAFAFPLPGWPGRYIFVADRWNEHSLANSRYVWLPLVVGTLETRWSVDLRPVDHGDHGDRGSPTVDPPLHLAHPYDSNHHDDGNLTTLQSAGWGGGGRTRPPPKNDTPSGSGSGSEIFWDWKAGQRGGINVAVSADFPSKLVVFVTCGDGVGGSGVGVGGSGSGDGVGASGGNGGSNVDGRRRRTGKDEEEREEGEEEEE